MEKKSEAAEEHVDVIRQTIIKFQTKRPSVMHTKHDSTKCQAQESRDKNCMGVAMFVSAFF